MTQGSSYPSLRKSVAWTAVGNAAYLGSQYGILMVLAKLGSATLVGEYSLGLAIVTPFFVLAQMQLRQVLVTDVRKELPFAAFFWIRALAGALAMTCSLAVVGVIRYDAHFLSVTALLGVAKFAESQSDMAYGAMQRRERMDLIAVSMISRGVFGLVAVTVTLAMGGSLLMACASLAGVWCAILFLVDLPLVRSGAIGEVLLRRWDGPAVRQLVRVSAPLTLAAGVGSLCGSLPRYVLELYEGPEAVAMFSVAMAPIALMGLFTGALSQATLARASVYLQTGRLAAFRSLALRLAGLNVLVGAGVVAGLLVAGDVAVRFFFTPEYEAAVPIMIILGLGVALSGLAAFGMTVLTAARRFSPQFAIALAALIVQVVGCFVLVPHFGLNGAAWADFGRLVTAGVLGQLVGWHAFSALSIRQAAVHGPRASAG
jgi:O-antigen/teichoic acid export membrane protein